MRRIKQNAIKIARMSLIALTFILALAIIIAAPMESSTDVALAAIDAQGGAVVGIYGKSGELTADKFGFPGTGSNTSSWTFTESFNGETLDPSKISACLYNTKQPLRLDNATDDNGNSIGGFRFGLNAHEGITDTDGWKAYAVLNYQLSPFLKTMIANTNATVKVTGAAVTFERLKGNTSLVKYMAKDSAVSAASIAGDSDSGYTSTTSTSATTLKPSSAVELSSSHNVVAIAFAIVGGAWGTSGDYYATGYVRNISLTFNITLTKTDYSTTVANDGEAPILQSINSKSPFREDNTINSNWNYNPTNDITTSVDDQILALYNQNLDRVDANNNVYLHSYVNPDTDAQTIDGKTYYKSVTETFVDQYSYGSSTVKTADASGFAWYASGIKYVKVGDTEMGIWGVSAGGTTSWKEITYDDGNGSKSYGWMRITKTHRSKVVVEMYFSANVDLSVIVTDYGSKQVAKSISIKGIDAQANSAMETIIKDSADFFMESSQFVDSGSWNNVNWNYTSQLAFEFNEDSVEREAQSPYMWFYSVVKADSPTRLTSANLDRATLMGMMPFAVNALNFSYDFKTGLANGSIGNQNGGSSATGSGYYLFTFYKMTLSGKFDSTTGVKSYFVKVDYEEAVHTLNKTSGGIDLNNIDWAAGAPLVITLIQDKPNISGNTLTFTTVDFGDIETTQQIFAKDGLIYVLDAEGNPKYETGSRITLHEGGRSVYVDYSINNESKAVWTITFASVILNSEQGRNTYANYNYISTFEIAVGVEPENDNVITYVDMGEKVVTDGTEHNKWQYLQGGKYRTGVYVRVDRNAPLAPNFMNSDSVEGDYIVEMEGFQIPAITERSWFTSGWTFAGQFDFSDDLVGEFGDAIKVFYTMKNVVTESDFAVLEAFVADYEGDGYNHLGTYGFDLYDSVVGSKLDDINGLNLALDSKLGSGMRVVFFWTVDQAGNRSALNKYYILADATTYYLTGHIDNGIFDGQTDVAMVSGNVKTPYKRGENAVVEYEINEESPYVPYTFDLDNGSGALVNLWTTSTPTSAEVSYDVAPVTIDGTTLTLAIDDSSLSKLQTQAGDSLDVYFSYREYVQMSVLNNSVYYSGEPTEVPFTISNENAKAFVQYNFEGFESNERPIDVGTYKFTMHIDTDSYITDAPVSMDYFINKKAITISINNSTGVYGDSQVFGYTVDGLVGRELEAWNPETYTFSIAGLSLPTASQWILFDGQPVAGNDFSTLDVGVYRLAFDLSVSDGVISENYTVVALSEARHIITQRAIVVTVVNGQKVYGDNDGQVKFTIDATTLPSGITGANITDVIKNAQVVAQEGNLITLSGDGLVAREIGEDVGVYDFSANASAFDTSANYKVVLDVEGKTFTITKRTVTVTPNSGQEFAYSEESDYNVVYMLDDYRYADALVAVWSFTQTGDVEIAGGFEQISMVVDGNLTSTNANVEFILANDVIIIVKKAVDGQATIIISKVDGVLNKTYDGTANIQSVVITSAGGNGFTYTVTNGTLPEGFRIEFTPSIAGSSVGNYMVDVDGGAVSVFDGASNISDQYVIFVESFTVTINPAVITVAPTFNSTDKVYGEMDVEYGIGYEATAVGFNGTDLGAIVNGSFVRAIYQGANLVAYGTRYDVVSAVDGTFEIDDVAYRYGVAVGNLFTSSNPNFVVEVVDLEGYMLTISPKAINFANINTSSLYANDKVFNNSPVATFANGEKEMMLDVTDQLVRMEDEVFVDFTALFTDFTAGENKTVQFSAFILAGEDSKNYILVGAEDVILEVTVNKNGNPIKITSKALVIEKRFFNIVKVYDGTSTITEANIVIDSECMLNGVEFYIANLIAFNGADVTDNFATDIVLMFKGITEDTFVIADESREFITIDNEGLKLSLSLVPGKITPKALEMTDFTDVVAVDRVYNGKDGVDMTFGLNSKVFGMGDGLADLGINIVAVADSVNVGTRAVTINAVEIASKNYKTNFTAEEFTAYVNGKVVISRAVVELNVQYNLGKEYSGRSKSTLTKTADGAIPADILMGDGRYGFKLVSDIDMDGTVWANEIGAITWNFDGVEFVYTIDGQANGSVQYRDGNVVGHNVKVSGLTLSSTNPEAMSNYEIVGYIWNDSTSQYEAKSIVLQAGEIEDFECIEVAPMAKKVITANNSIQVLPKVYDGTRKASATADITTELGIAPEDVDYVDFEYDAQFETKNIGEQKVTLRIIGFANKENAPEDIASNYDINSSTTWVTRQSILPAPMLIEANVGEKVYDGTASLNIADVRFTLVGVFASETDTYAVDALAGRYDDANVFDENGNITGVKGAKLYGVSLRNISTSCVNYYPVFASAEKIVGLEEVTELGALPATDSEGNAIYYYKVKTESVYQLTAEEFAEVEGTDAMAYYIDDYTRSRTTYYLFEAGANFAGKEMTTLAVDENAVGAITQREVTMIVEVLNKDAFNKTYDATSVFYGVAGTDFDISMNAGFVGTDGEKVALDVNGFTVAYSTSKAGVAEVKFVFADNALAGVGSDKTYLNYTATGATYVVKGSIKKAQMNVVLDAIQATYGDNVNGYEYEIHYSVTVDGNDYGVIVSETRGYMLATDYAVAYAEHWASLSVEEQNALRYALQDGAFAQSASGEYVKLSDTIINPSMATNATNQAIIGTYGATLKGGSATNYAFNFGYSRFEGETSVYDETLTSSEVVVGKKTLKVSAGNGICYRATYLETLPEIKLSYVGFVGNDGANKITVAPGATKFMFYNGTELVDMPENPIPSSALENGQYYVAVVDVTKLSSANYVFEADDEAKAMLEIVMPAFTGITVKDTTVIYNGQSQANKLSITGDLIGVSVSYKYYLGSVEVDEVKNVGVYTVVSTFTKMVGEFEQTETFTNTLTIEKADFSIELTTNKFDYQERNSIAKDFTGDIKTAIADGLKGVFASDKEAMLANLSISFYRVEIDGSLKAVSTVTNADNYVVKVAFSMPNNVNADVAKILANYNDYTYSYEFKVVPAPIVITILEAENYIVAEYDEEGKFILPGNINVVFKFDFAESYKEQYGISASELDAEKFFIQFGDQPNKVIKGTGIFAFTIIYVPTKTADTSTYSEDSSYTVIKVGATDKLSTVKDKVSTNYKFTGNVGNFFVRTSQIGEPGLSMEFVDGSTIVASGLQLTATEITEFVESDALYEYWLSIQANEANIRQGNKKADAEVIMQLRLVNNGVIVQPGKDVKVSVNFLLEYPVDEYVFYIVGKDGLLHLIEDYTISEDGTLTFITSRIDSVVAFRMVEDKNANQLPSWFWYAVGGGAGGLVLIIIIVCCVSASKKKKRAAEGPDGDKPSKKAKEPKQKKETKKTEPKKETAPAQSKSATPATAPKAAPAPTKPVAPTPQKPVQATPTKPVTPAPTKPVAPAPAKPVAQAPQRPAAPTQSAPKTAPPAVGSKPATAPVQSKPVAPTTAPKAAPAKPVASAPTTAPKATPAKPVTSEPATAPKAAPAPQKPTAPPAKPSAPPTVGTKPTAPPVVGSKPATPPTVGTKPATPPTVGTKPSAPPVVGKK